MKVLISILLFFILSINLSIAKSRLQTVNLGINIHNKAQYAGTIVLNSFYATLIDIDDNEDIIPFFGINNYAKSALSIVKFALRYSVLKALLIPLKKMPALLLDMPPPML